MRCAAVRAVGAPRDEQAAVRVQPWIRRDLHRLCCLPGRLLEERVVDPLHDFGCQFHRWEEDFREKGDGAGVIAHAGEILAGDWGNSRSNPAVWSVEGTKSDGKASFGG